MTDNNHPITPPPELVEQWCYEDGDEIRTSPRWYRRVCAKAARWGADQELDACCEYLTKYASWEPEDVQEMRDARRPKPLSMIDQSIALIDKIQSRKGMWHTDDLDIVRRCLKRLQGLEGQGDD